MTIYKATNKLNGKVYIGKHERDQFPVSHRWDEHRRAAASGAGKRSHFYCAIRKNEFENFVFSILQVGIKTREELRAAECKWIAEYNATDSRYGYNMTHGGDGGAIRFGPHTDESCAKISTALKGKKRKGNWHSSGEFQPGSKVNLGRKRPDAAEMLRKYHASLSVEERRKQAQHRAAGNTRRSKRQQGRTLSLRCGMKKVNGQLLLLQHCCGCYL